jgi:small-conductance mechanosensitive channel
MVDLAVHEPVLLRHVGIGSLIGRYHVQEQVRIGVCGLALAMPGGLRAAGPLRVVQPGHEIGIAVELRRVDALQPIQQRGTMAVANLVVTPILGFISGWLLSVLLRQVSKTEQAWPTLVGRIAFFFAGWPLIVLSYAFCLMLALGEFKLTGPGQAASHGVFLLFFSIPVAGYLYRLAPYVEGKLKAWTSDTESTIDDLLVPAAGTVMRIGVWTLWVLFVVGAVLDWSVRPWLAGLGIAGAVVGLAAKEPLENVIGYVTILSDRPFQVGDHVIIGDIAGRVEDIGMRSVLLRTADGRLARIPNAKAARETVIRLPPGSLDQPG